LRPIINSLKNVAFKLIVLIVGRGEINLPPKKKIKKK